MVANLQKTSTAASINPDGWSICPFLSAVKIVSGQVDPKLEPFRSMTLVAPDHIESDTGRLLEKVTAKDQGAISGKYTFEPGDVIYSKIRPYLKKAIYADFEGLCSADMYALRPKDGVSAKFILGVLLGYRFSQYADTVSMRSGMPKINREDLSQFNFVMPPFKEQCAIGRVFEDTDNLLASLEKLITKKRDIKKATMQQLLSGKTRLPGFSGKWCRIQIKTDASLKARIGWQALTTAEYLKSGDYFLVTGTDFSGGKVLWSTCSFVSKWRFDQDSNIQLRTGDVLLTKDGTIGKVGFVEDLSLPATLNSGVFVIRPLGNKFIPKFLFYILTSRIFLDFINKITAGSTITHLYQKDFINFNFLAPEIKEQAEISNILSTQDSEIEALELKLEKLKLLKQGMMQELLTGRIRLV